VSSEITTVPNVAPGVDARGRARLLSIATIAAIGLLPLVLLAPFVNAPFERDEAVYATVARGLLDGAVPYRDLFDHKPPFVHLWYALSFVAFGESVVAPRIMAALFYSGTALAVFAQARLLFDRPTALAAGLATGATAGLVMLRAVANVEVFTILPMTLALLAATLGFRSDQPRAWRWFAAAGLLSAVAVLTKQVALLPTAAIGIVIVLNGERRIRNGGAFASAGVATLVVVVLPFVAVGAFDDWFYANVTYNLLYFRADGPGPVSSTLTFLVAAAPLVLLAAVGARSIARTTGGAPRWLLALWVAAIFATVLTTGRAYAHYWVLTVPALGLLAAPALVAIGSVPRLTIPRRVAVWTALILATALAVAVNLPPYLAGSSADRHVVQYGTAGDRDVEAAAVADRVGELLEGREGAIYELGRETSIYFYATRQPPVRFMFDRQFYLDPATLEEAISGLRVNPPELILLTRAADDPPYSDGSVPIAVVSERLVPPPVVALLDEEYQFVERIEFADIYRLVPAR